MEKFLTDIHVNRDGISDYLELWYNENTGKFELSFHSDNGDPAKKIVISQLRCKMLAHKILDNCDK